jgi:hypothetical protein
MQEYEKQFSNNATTIKIYKKVSDGNIIKTWMHKHNKTQNCKNPKVQYFKKHWHAKNQKHKNTKTQKTQKM